MNRKHNFKHGINNRVFTGFSVLAFVFAFSSALLANESDSDPQYTAMNTVTNLLELKVCKKKLDDLALDLIGIKKHRILHYSKSGDDQLFNALMVLEYHDRTAHVNFASSVTQSGECQANYTLTFAVDIPCALAREEVIKIFLPKGKLSRKTFVYQHKRKPHLVAITSPTNRGRGCLVTHKTK